MIFKNNYRPALATAGAPCSFKAEKKAQSGIMFNSADETEDFNAFQGSSSQQKEMKRRPQKKKTTLELSLKTLLIAAASVVALILLIVVVVAALNSSGTPITAENNSFISYENDGRYYVAMNGEIIGDGFENEIELTPAADNSFAYVFEDTPDGINAYILDKKELTLVIPTPVSEIVTVADYEPGIIYKDDDAFYFYADDSDDKITKNPTAGNFIIAPDASAVAYTEAKDEDVTQSKLYLYTNGNEDSYATNMCPVAVAPGGKYIYAYGIDSDAITKKLYMISPEDDEKYSIASNFNAITYMNIKGDEIIYCTSSVNDGFSSHIYSAKKNESFKIGAGWCVPLTADPTTVRLSSLKNIVVENTFSLSELNTKSATYYIGKDYTSARISTYNGKLNSSGDIFYYTDSDNTLKYIDLNDKTRTSEEIAEDVLEFVVTAKDNIYFIDDDGRLRFHKSSSGKSKTIESGEVTNMSLNAYSNILYFDVEDDAKAYCTEEGSAKEIAEFARAEIYTAPEFVDGAQKRTFAYVKNSDTELYDIYYTSSGKTYKLIATDCDYINGDDITIEDIINGIEDAVTGEGSGDSEG